MPKIKELQALAQQSAATRELPPVKAGKFGRLPVVPITGCGYPDSQVERGPNRRERYLKDHPEHRKFFRLIGESKFRELYTDEFEAIYRHTEKYARFKNVNPDEVLRAREFMQQVFTYCGFHMHAWHKNSQHPKLFAYARDVVLESPYRVVFKRKLDYLKEFEPKIAPDVHYYSKMLNGQVIVRAQKAYAEALAANPLAKKVRTPDDIAWKAIPKSKTPDDFGDARDFVQEKEDALQKISELEFNQLKMTYFPERILEE